MVRVEVGGVEDGSVSVETEGADVAGVVSAGRAVSGKRCGELPRRVLGSGIDFNLEPCDVVLAGQYFKEVSCGIAVTAVGKLLEFVGAPLGR
jgi:hypothetical protein